MKEIKTNNQMKEKGKPTSTQNKEKKNNYKYVNSKIYHIMYAMERYRE